MTSTNRIFVCISFVSIFFSMCELLIRFKPVVFLNCCFSTHFARLNSNERADFWALLYAVSNEVHCRC